MPPAAPDDDAAAPAADLHRVADTLAHAFFQVVPHHLRTFCAVNAQIAQRALAEFGLAASVVPCQVLLARPESNFVVGYVAERQQPGKWDGHAICRVGPLFIDAALHHFQREFQIPVPDVVMGRVFQAQVTAIARVDLNATDRLWWLPPPPGASHAIPHEPDDLIVPLALELAAQVRARLSAGPS